MVSREKFDKNPAEAAAAATEVTASVPAAPLLLSTETPKLTTESRVGIRTPKALGAEEAPEVVVAPLFKRHVALGGGEEEEEEPTVEVVITGLDTAGMP